MLPHQWFPFNSNDFQKWHKMLTKSYCSVITSANNDLVAPWEIQASVGTTFVWPSLSAVCLQTFFLWCYLVTCVVVRDISLACQPFVAQLVLGHWYFWVPSGFEKLKSPAEFWCLPTIVCKKGPALYCCHFVPIRRQTLSHRMTIVRTTSQDILSCLEEWFQNESADIHLF